MRRSVVAVRGFRPARTRIAFSVLVVSALYLAPTPARALLWPSEASRIERDLEASDVAVRRRAATRLRELPEKTAQRAVFRALGDGDLEVRLTAVETAKVLRVPGLSARVLGWLTETDARLRLAAAEALASEPSPKAVGPLSRALSDIEPQVRAAAATALGTSGAPEAVIGLLGRLDDPALEVRESVVRALARLGDGRAVVPLVSKIEDSRPAIRRSVVRALGELGDRRAVSALVLALRDSDPTVRSAALEGLGELGDATAVPSVSAVLSEETAASVRVAAIDSLGRLGTPEAITKLLDAFTTLPDEREPLVRALARNGAKAVPALSRCLESSGNRARADGCALALGLCRPEDGAKLVLSAVRRGLTSPEASLAALAELGDPAAVPLALEHLGHRDPAVRRAALLAAGALLEPTDADGRAVEPLELAFQKAKHRRSERLELLALLGLTGSPRAARVLVPIADRADDLEYRLAALAALGTIHDRSASPALLRGLSDPEPSVRLTAALSIRKSAPSDVAEELMNRLERAGAQDRKAIALALAGAVVGAPDGVVSRLVKALASADGDERDALIEALSHARTAGAAKALLELARSRDPADRAKAAEGLALRANAGPTLLALIRDPDPGVRANALWSLGAIGGAPERAAVARSLADRDVAVAANAAAALGRLSTRMGSPASKELCRALDDRRPAVRASALSALRLARSHCEGRARALLASDPSAKVRAQAAELLRDVTTDDAASRALRRCALSEPTGAVAAACVRLPQALPKGSSEVVVFVVPAGESTPVARAPFALRRPDSLVRYGQSDRRGAVDEIGVPNGELTLDVPAALEE